MTVLRRLTPWPRFRWGRREGGTARWAVLKTELLEPRRMLAADLLSVDTPCPTLGTIDFISVNENGDRTVDPRALVMVLSAGEHLTAQPVDPDALSVATGDFNHDGFSDLATTYSGSHFVSILVGDGDRDFVVHSRVLVGDTPNSIVAADFDGDGILDLATANRRSSVVSVLRGNGDATFSPRSRMHVGGIIIDHGGGPESLVSGDFNDDGHVDLATVNHWTMEHVSLLLGKGDGTFWDAVHVADAKLPSAVSGISTLRIGVGGLSPVAVTTGDFNGDGRSDLATANRDSGDVSVLLRSGDRIVFEQARFAVGDKPASVTTADFNNDGFLDLATANAESNDVSVLLGYGDGTFARQSTFPVGDRPVSLTTGQFNDDNQDGRIDDRDFVDLATANDGSDSNMLLLLGHGDGTFGVERRLACVFGCTSVTTGQLNDDNQDGVIDDDDFLDLAMTVTWPDSVNVALGNGDGTFSGRGWPYATNVDDYPESLVVGDFNRDGKTDLATANAMYGFSESVSVLLADELGRNGYVSESRIPLGFGSMPLSLAIGQFNDDNRDGLIDDEDFLDLATANSGLGEVLVLAGKGDGTFAGKGRFPVGVEPRSVTTFDFDGNGILDLATANSSSNDVTVLIGNGDGTFSDRVALDADDFSVTSGDFNGDGRSDLALASENLDQVLVLVSNGDKTFTQLGRFTVGDAPRSVTPGDFDRTRPAWSAYARWNAPVSVTAGDFDRDGQLDLATANEHSHDVSVLLGKGPDVFSVEYRTPVGDAPISVTAGHFDGDRHLDLVTVNKLSNDVSVLLGRGDGTFAPEIRFKLGEGPVPVNPGLVFRPGDANRDGVFNQLDLVTVLQKGDNYMRDVPTGWGGGDWNGDGRFDQHDIVLALQENEYTPKDAASLAAGDANGDGRFDRQDVMAMLAAGKYLTSQPATWEEGDFTGDGIFDPLDIIAALQTGTYH